VSKNAEGKSSSMDPMSLVKRFIILPIYVINKIYVKNQRKYLIRNNSFELPDGLSSKNFVGARTILLNILSCRLLLIFRQYEKKPNALAEVNINRAATSPA